MPDLNTQAIHTYIATQGGDFLIAVATAIVTWIVGRWLIKMASKLLARMLQRGGRIDATLSRYLQSIMSAVLHVILILALLDIFGVRTTSFAALFAGVGLAIGAAWGGMLGNFAAGLFMQVLRPYKVGDYIQAGGVEGTVQELGILATTLITGDNVMVTAGNASIFGNNIKNYSSLPVRQVSCEKIIANDVDPFDAIARLTPALQAIENVAREPAASVVVTGFTPAGPKLSASCYTNQKTYWQVYCDMHKAIIRTFRAADYPVPETPVAYHLGSSQDGRQE